MTPAEQKRAAKQFVARWKSLPCVEEEHSRSFWIELLQDVLGVQNATHSLEFERKVKGRKIDVFYEDMGILIEQKGRGISLDKASERSKKAGEETPYQQACWYAANLPYSLRPRWIITCNFDELRVYDQEAGDDSFVSFTLDELPNQVHLLSFFTDKRNSRLVKEKELSVKAGELVGKLYAQLSRQYRNIDTDAHEQRSLNVLIVRLVFLLYAEDSGLLHEKDALLNYLRRFSADQMRQAVIDLFAVLDTPYDKRDPYLPDYLLAFSYVNGGLFSNDDIVIPQFTDQIRLDLLLEASQSFDWSGISPTIFGAAFESTLNPETRRSGGMHYTSIENIHKVIDPLFLDDLKAELAAIEGEKVERNRKVKLRAFQRKLAGINIFDPACGSGNFLTESYLSLRKLENRVLENLQGDQMGMGFDKESSPIQVSISQFYGIEINDFAVSVAKTALWIAEEQMMEATQEILSQPFDFLPLKSNGNIHEGNALRMDWNDVLPAEQCTYLCGNPPFLGARNQNKEQKAELMDVFGGAKNSGNVDYVAGWYMKAAEYMGDCPMRCAFVSTNSICQGEQVANVWRPLWDLGIRIDFAHDTFRWVNEANGQAHVFVIIVGFSKSGGCKRLFHHAGPDAPAMELHPSNINAYLSGAPDAFVQNLSKSLCNVPKIGIGNKPIDGGNYLFKPDELESFLKEEPAASEFVHPWLGSDEFINGKKRFVLWLGGATPAQLDALPKCRERIAAVREFRLASKSAPTRKLAETPARFHVENMPKGPSVLVPKVSSERRCYIPLGFVEPPTLCSDLVFLIPDATLYHFGMLHSQMHNAWMRTVCGRLESRYRYSGGVVYNNFPWPGASQGNLSVPVEQLVSPEARQRIEACAQGVLDARAAHPSATLADLYDPDKMPYDLLAAHKALDAAVEAAYGVDFNGDEERIVAHLFKLYAQITEHVKK